MGRSPCLLFYLYRMTIKVLAIGKTDKGEIERLCALYEDRVSRYTRFEFEYLPDVKMHAKRSPDEQARKEGDLLLKKLEGSTPVFLLDESGKTYSSEGFAGFLQKQMNSGIRQLTLVIGGPYGFSDSVYARAHGKISLSRMTFSHQMVRLFLVEQLYRAFTILNNEPYHHQ